MEKSLAAAGTADRPDTTGQAHRLAAQVRLERNRQKLSVRELARRIGVSGSLISQIETGRVQPSVTTLMALVTELGLSLNDLFSDRPVADTARPASSEIGGPSSLSNSRTNTTFDARSDSADNSSEFGETGLSQSRATALWSKSVGLPPLLSGTFSGFGVQRSGKRAFLQLDSGVRWERLTPFSLPGMEFLHVRYEVDASSNASGNHTRHQGIEFGYVTVGRLHVTVGFDLLVLDPGDSIMFDASTPHLLANHGPVPTEAVWLIIGRSSLPAGQPDLLD